MVKKYDLVTERKVIPPIDGWQERTYYRVFVSFNANNPVHEAIFYSGFLNGQGRTPGGYNQAWNPTWDNPVSLRELFFLEVKNVLYREND